MKRKKKKIDIERYFSKMNLNEINFKDIHSINRENNAFPTSNTNRLTPVILFYRHGGGKKKSLDTIWQTYDFNLTKIQPFFSSRDAHIVSDIEERVRERLVSETMAAS